jgi:tetratricopeptide (TPR) repeat protein/transcriptional regulator with XRE-family HTH domain
VDGQQSVSFGEVLRRLRADAGLTQEELAEAAGLSVRSISDLERGINQTARKDTARLLADALGLTGAARAAFDATARGRSAVAGFSVDGSAGAVRTLPRDTASFTGRQPELRRVAGAGLTHQAVEVYTIGGMPGIGKTAFAVHAAHQMAPRFPDGQVFFQLHGHTPGQRPVAPVDALSSLLLAVGVPAEHVPPGLEARAALWRDRVAGKRLLLVLDDAVESEQVRPLLPGSGESLVLVTSRRHLTALEDAYAVSLDTLFPGEATELLVRLAGRPAPAAGDPALGEIARLCGCLPLALGMLASQLRHHPAWTPADLAAELAATRDRLSLMAVENLSVAAAFDLSYQDLTPGQRRLFHRLGLHPGTEIDAYAAAALDGTELPAGRRSLAGLYEHYLLTEMARGRYRMHDLVREHARALAAADPDAESATAVGRLLDYYVHTARSADNRRAVHNQALAWEVTVAAPRHAPDLPTWEAKAAWLRVERSNLAAAVEYAAAHDMPGHAAAVADAMHAFLLDEGHYEQSAALLRLAAAAARRAGDPLTEATALANLSDVQRTTGGRQAARASLDRALELYRDRGDRYGEATALRRIGQLQYLTDDLKGAEASLSQALALFTALGDAAGEAGCVRRLGVIQQTTGDYAGARESLVRALELDHSVGNQNGEAWALLSLGEVEQLTGNYAAAGASFARVLELARALGDQVLRADILNRIGDLDRETGDYPAALSCHQEALKLSRDLSYQLGEANAVALLGLAQMRTGDYLAADTSEQRALRLYRELGDQEGESGVLNALGELALARDDPAEARARHEEALAVATSVPLPMHEAQALEGIGAVCLREGEPDQAAPLLRQALRIYRDIGAPRAGAVERTLHEHGL